MRFTLRGARLIDATTEIANSDITIDGEHIQAPFHDISPSITFTVKTCIS